MSDEVAEGSSSPLGATASSSTVLTGAVFTSSSTRTGRPSTSSCRPRPMASMVHGVDGSIPFSIPPMTSWIGTLRPSSSTIDIAQNHAPWSCWSSTDRRYSRGIRNREGREPQRRPGVLFRAGPSLAVTTIGWRSAAGFRPRNTCATSSRPADFGFPPNAELFRGALGRKPSATCS